MVLDTISFPNIVYRATQDSLEVIALNSHSLYYKVSDPRGCHYCYDMQGLATRLVNDIVLMTLRYPGISPRVLLTDIVLVNIAYIYASSKQSCKDDSSLAIVCLDLACGGRLCSL